MHHHMEIPATLGACGVPVVDIAAGKIDPETNPSLLNLQASRLTRRCAITATMAAIIAPLVFGEPS